MVRRPTPDDPLRGGHRLEAYPADEALRLSEGEDRRRSGQIVICPYGYAARRGLWRRTGQIVICPCGYTPYAGCGAEQGRS